MVYNVNLLFLKIMEEKKMNEMESLETITKMLQATKGEDMRSIVIRFRVWGTACLLVGLLAFFATTYLISPWWHTMWFSMFLVPLIPAARGEHEGHRVTTFLDESIQKVLGATGTYFAVASVAIIIFGLSTGNWMFQLLAPLAVVVLSFNLMQVWALTKRRGFYLFSLVMLLAGMLMLCRVVLHLPLFTPLDHLCTGILLGLLFLVPANVNSRPKKVRS